MSNFINNSHKIVLIHIPKCGGSSIRLYSNLNFEKRYLGYIPEEYQKYTIIGMTRHPIDRFLSAYKMFKYGTSDKEKRMGDLDVNTAIDILDDDNISPGPVSDGTMELMSPQEHFKHHVIPISHPYNCMEYSTEIIRFENYVEDTSRLFNGVEIPHRNKTEKRDVSLTNEEKERLYDIYQEDFETYGYELR